MELNFNLTSLLDSTGIIQGTVLGIFLIALNKKKNKSTFFLGLFLVLFAIQRVPVVLKELNIFEFYPELYRLPFNFFWLLFPLFYIYTQQVSIFANHKINYWLLYPGIISFVLQLFFFFLPYQTKLSITQLMWYDLFFISGLIYGWIVAVWNIKLLLKHKIEVNNYFSMAKNKELKWAQSFLVIFTIGSIFYTFLYYFVPENIFSRGSFLIFDLLIIYWVSYQGIVQQNIFAISTKTKSYELSGIKKTNNNKANPIDLKNLKAIMIQIDEFMVSSESYSNSELTIMDLNEKIKIHPKRISTAINTIRGQNFNSYVNQLRIKKAELLLKDKASKNLSVEGIGSEVGFHSKSAFYTAFKRVTGTTPSKYKLKHTG